MEAPGLKTRVLYAKSEKRFLALESSFLKFRQKEKNRHLICKISDNFCKRYFLIRRLFFRSFFDTFSKRALKGGSDNIFEKNFCWNSVQLIFRKSHEVSGEVSLRFFRVICKKLEGGGGATVPLGVKLQVAKSPYKL